MASQHAVYKQVVATLVTERSDWGLTVGSFGKGSKNPYWRSMQALQIGFGSAPRAMKLDILTMRVGRPIRSSYDLTVAELIAFNRMNNPQGAR